MRYVSFMSTSILSVVFRTEKNGIGTGDISDSKVGSDLDKAQLRRAQVRKAQIQHRQRKADYIKQLEVDVARIRDLIADAQREAQNLKRENDTMKSQLRQPVAGPRKIRPPPSAEKDPLFTTDDIDSSYSLLGLEDITMTLEFDDVMNAPSFRISSSPSDSHYESSNQSLYLPDAPSPARIPNTTPDQTQEAINFILA